MWTKSLLENTYFQALSQPNANNLNILKTKQTVGRYTHSTNWNSH